MSDLISRQATINAMRKEVQMTHDENDEQVYFIDADDAIFVLENMPSTGEWIPCSERFPEEGLPVVITAQDADGRFVDISIRSDVNYWSGFGRINVLAWMPIPEPYKGGAL